LFSYTMRGTHLPNEDSSLEILRHPEEFLPGFLHSGQPLCHLSVCPHLTTSKRIPNHHQFRILARDLAYFFGANNCRNNAS
jgi:hypothetical protein